MVEYVYVCVFTPVCVVNEQRIKDFNLVTSIYIQGKEKLFVHIYEYETGPCYCSQSSGSFSSSGHQDLGPTFNSS